MTRQDYEKMTEAELVGRFVATTVDMQNGRNTIAKGTIAKITRKFGGLDLNVAPCTHCGVGVRISRVKPADVDLLPKSFRPRK